MNTVKELFQQLKFKIDSRRDQCVVAYRKFTTSFEDWLSIVLQRLTSGDLLTTDILQFEEHLTVRFIFFLSLFCNQRVEKLKNSTFCQYFPNNRNLVFPISESNFFVRLKIFFLLKISKLQTSKHFSPKINANLLF